ncbi:hypothetical protein Q9299_20190, partial [Gemmobacter fulvus]|nr:hypothetical protein [Gemmobacter fulvus]
MRPFFGHLFQTQSCSLGQDAMTMVAEIGNAFAAASSQLVPGGYFTPFIVMFNTDEARLPDQTEVAQRLIQAESVGTRIATTNATGAYPAACRTAQAVTPTEGALVCALAWLERVLTVGGGRACSS